MKLFAIAILLTSCLTQEEINKRIAKSRDLTLIDNFCKEFPKPPEFTFAEKEIAGNSEKYAISYYYSSNLLSAKVKDFYLHYFQQNGWTQIFIQEKPLMMEFNLNDKTISIQRVSFSNADYTVYCSQER